MMASAVLITMPIRMAPLTRSAISAAMISRPTMNTVTGQPRSVPVPNWTGTVVPATSGTRRTMPASTSPISAMNSPMPTPIEVLSWAGMARTTAVRKPVSTSTVMISPSQTTRPIASGHDILLATPTAMNAFSPRPVAMANGYRPTTPMSTVITAATSAVTAATRGMPSTVPSASFTVPMISGLSTTM